MKNKWIWIIFALVAGLVGIFLLLALLGPLGWQGAFYTILGRITPSQWRELEGQRWVLQSVQTQDGMVLWTPEQPGSIWFELDKQRIVGSAGCNEFYASYWSNTITHAFVTYDVFYTLIACFSPTRMQQEDEFLQALTTAGHYTLANGRLRITYDSGEKVLILSP